MSCHHKPGGLQDLLDEAWGRQPTRGSADPKAPTPRERRLGPGPLPFQFAKKVERTIDEYIRPMLQQDGGDLEVVDIKEMLVYCRLTGACGGCAAPAFTMKLMVERTLKEMVDERIRVINV